GYAVGHLRDRRWRRQGLRSVVVRYLRHVDLRRVVPVADGTVAGEQDLAGQHSRLHDGRLVPIDFDWQQAVGFLRRTIHEVGPLPLLASAGRLGGVLCLRDLPAVTLAQPADDGTTSVTDAPGETTAGVP